jgi:hypothetical protein
MDTSNRLEISIGLGPATFSAAGEASVVMDALEKFTSLAQGAELTLDEPEAAGGSEGEPAAPVKPATTQEKQVLPEFLSGRSLKGNAEVATAIVAWAQKYDGKPMGLRRSEIAGNWRNTRVKEPGNLGRDLGTAIKAGLLHREGGQYTVTGFGKTTIGLTD